MKNRLQHLKSQRGIALISTAVALTALIALTAVGVDVGRLVFTATEVQSTADIAATAGAKSLVLQGSGSAQSGAEVVAGANYIDGKKVTGSNLDSIEEGNYTAGVFTPGGAPVNAVRATASASVNNILASVFGDPVTKVTKKATAAYASVGSAQPQLPLAIGDCDFTDPDCLDNSCLPQFFQVPSTEDNSAWTGFFGVAGGTAIGDLFPEECEGEGNPIPTVQIGDEISLNNGQAVGSILNLVENCFNAGLTEFLVPVIDCDAQYVQGLPVLGFATIVIHDVITTGNPKYIEASVTFDAEVPGAPGGGTFGSGSVVLVN